MYRRADCACFRFADPSGRKKCSCRYRGRAAQFVLWDAGAILSEPPERGMTILGKRFEFYAKVPGS